MTVKCLAAIETCSCYDLAIALRRRRERLEAKAEQVIEDRARRLGGRSRLSNAEARKV